MRNRKLLFNSTPKRTFQRYSFQESTVQSSRYASSLPVLKYAFKIYNNCLVKLSFVCILCFSRICFHFALFAFCFHLLFSIFLYRSFSMSIFSLLKPGYAFTVSFSSTLYLFITSYLNFSLLFSSQSLSFYFLYSYHFILNFKSIPFIPHHRLDVAPLKTGSEQMDRYSNKNCRDFHFVMTQLSPPLFLFLIQVPIH